MRACRFHRDQYQSSQIPVISQGWIPSNGDPIWCCCCCCCFFFLLLCLLIDTTSNYNAGILSSTLG
ncbi:hypothetical protein BO70DRAFT_45124 [Aspergillus heteromorphus CBS 117.55]|uniref:Uncharacterized protein n=1 Tax=Aspergillus heteromorphus CBS 117.55 TaxID=1448321 RepID=A0A317W4P2_9EURO|nr:uncharacterized protein BO70DRAFT_45124 [Aspergillus heteromorphus CBS 117.55]PWY80531.1 hypothetical protein BO70DRAFT_45124 [Aspergillus heteromorphus CBS 117.55]